MKASTVDVERFMMHTELYLLLTGKEARELNRDDMDQIDQHVRRDQGSDSGRCQTIYN